MLHDRCQYLAEALCGTERYALAYSLAVDPFLPIATEPVLLRWAHDVISRIGHLREECISCLRRRLDGHPSVSWAAVAAYALVRPPVPATLAMCHTRASPCFACLR
jgi:hypothetical protein